MSFNQQQPFDPNCTDGKTEISKNKVFGLPLTHLEGGTIEIRTQGA